MSESEGRIGCILPTNRPVALSMPTFDYNSFFANILQDLQCFPFGQERRSTLTHYHFLAPLPNIAPPVVGRTHKIQK